MQNVMWRQTLLLWLFTFFNIPLIAWLRPRVWVLNNSRSVIVIPLRRRSRNHLRSMYFAAICAGADLAPGLLTMHLLKQHKEKCSFLFKDYEANFIKRCEADVHFIFEEGHLIEETINKAIQTNDRQNITLNVVATTPSISGNEPVATFKLTISIKKRDRS